MRVEPNDLDIVKSDEIILGIFNTVFVKLPAVDSIVLTGAGTNPMEFSTTTSGDHSVHGHACSALFITGKTCRLLGLGLSSNVLVLRQSWWVFIFSPLCSCGLLHSRIESA